MLNAQAAQDQV